MATSLLQKIDRERQIARDTEVVEAAKMVNVHLSASWPRPVEIPWCMGRGHKNTLTIIRPGQSVVQPLDRMRSYFGPFDLFGVYEKETNERKLEALREILATESARVLNRYDYERLAGEGYKPKMTPTAPHRLPDLTMTILNSDGSSEAPIRLHEIYGIGEFDDISFEKKETLEEITARHQAAMATKDEEHKAEVRALAKQLAELSGMVKGIVLMKDAPEAQKEAS